MTNSLLHSQRFAHLSDVHLPPEFHIPPHAMLGKRGLSVMSWRRRRARFYRRETADAVVTDLAGFAPDIIADTGDLTNFGLPKEFANGAAWLQKMPAPTVVVPGNHDAMSWGARSQALAAWSRWSAPHINDFPFVRQVGHLAIIGVCSAIASPPFMACGRVGTGQLERLQRVLEATRDSCRIVLIHHPVIPGMVAWRKSLLGWRRVAEVLQSAGAELVLHGHAHCAATHTVPGTTIPLIGSPSASLRSEKEESEAGWNAFTIANERDYWRIELTRRRITAEGTFQDAGCICWLRPKPVVPDNIPARLPRHDGLRLGLRAGNSRMEAVTNA
ncbi:metallophosphoesterase family protein [Acetobacter conturbans]|uniref:Metallophosphoesterase n=1 Tax=Acetobacter conturbans TaxID=1737472 RepID=A0ABX0K1G8_9PROT|nr:metallophosphoesterase [Acetobacter conturbans]NHN89581.1 metallophosphoesterase [Acetobacter conturbans]